MKLIVVHTWFRPIALVYIYTIKGLLGTRGHYFQASVNGGILLNICGVVFGCFPQSFQPLVT